MTKLNKDLIFNEMILSSSDDTDLYHDYAIYEWGTADDFEYNGTESIDTYDEIGNDDLIVRYYHSDNTTWNDIIDNDNYGIGVIKKMSILGQLVHSSSKVLSSDCIVHHEPVYLFVFPDTFTVNGNTYQANKINQLTNVNDRKTFLERYVIDEPYNDFIKQLKF